MGVWVDLRAGLDNVEKRKFFTIPGLELRTLGRLSRSQSLYRLRYPGFFIELICYGILPLEIKLMAFVSMESR
jgi:hypothetical protein